MIDFTFQNPTRIHFGRGAMNHLESECRALGATRVLLVYGGGSIKRTGVYDQVMERLSGAQVWELGGVQPNPRLSLAQRGVELCREHGVELVLAVGGGSAIDTGKAIANGACYDGPLWDLFDGSGTNARTLPLGTVVTLPAAGSEMSNSCVLTRDEDLCKRGRNTPLNFPVFSILNPEFTFTLPPFQTACGVADIMAHMMERYFTRVSHVELTDRLMEAALVTVMRNAPLVMQTPDDYDARAEIMWAGCLAHNTLYQTGRVGDWASHKLEHELSALYDIAHGAGLAVVFPAWMRYVLPRGGAPKLAQFARRVLGVTQEDDESAAREGVERLEAFWQSLGLGTRLKDYGIDGRNVERMAQRCTAMVGGTVGAFVVLDEAACREIYRLAL